MQAAGKGVRGLARLQSTILGQSRAFATAADSAVTRSDDSAFLRFASPVPAPYNYTNLLGSIPGTQVILHEIFMASTVLWTPSRTMHRWTHVRAAPAVLQRKA